MTYKPNFKKAYILANEILLKSRIINAFPFSVTKLIKEISDIQCCSFKRAQKYNVDIEAFGSDSAILTEFHGRQIIFYNQFDIDERVRFSMLHEIGHCLLDHNMDTCNKELYKKQEIETNFFAAQLLMPEQTLLELQSRGKNIDYFKVFISDAIQERMIAELQIEEGKGYFKFYKFLNQLNESIPLKIKMQQKVNTLRNNRDIIKRVAIDDIDKTVLIGTKLLSRGKPQDKTLRKLYMFTEESESIITEFISNLKKANMTVAWTTEDQRFRVVDINSLVNGIIVKW